MDLYITPEPHYIPGYTGHCPQLNFREGKTYGKLSHKLLLDPCAKHAPQLILTTPSAPMPLEYPTENEIKTLIDRNQFSDTIYNHPLIPGYEGFVPNLANKIGKRYMAAATAGIVEHEALAEQLRCEKRLQQQSDVLESGNGLFQPKLRERMIPTTRYRAPLLPVKSKAQAVKIEECIDEKEHLPYSKFTTPHFLDDNDEEKYIKNGYSGHIPMAMTRYGQSSKQLTNSALCEFTNNYHHRKSAEWCPREMAGIASSRPNVGQFIVYHRTIGMIPKYAGHVPGEAFTFGQTYGNATVNAKYWLALHKD